MRPPSTMAPVRRPIAASTVGSSNHAPTLQHFSRTCREIYQLCPSLPVLAIRWVHLKHPLHPIQEAFLKEQQQEPASGRLERVRSAWAGLLRLARCVSFGAYLSVCLLRVRWVLRRERRTLRRQAFAVIARTCCFTTERPADGKDFYFGDLQQRLAAAGLPMLLLCGDASNARWPVFARGQVTTSSLPRLPELGMVPPWAALHMVALQIFSAFQLWRQAGGLSAPFAQRLCRAASRDCLVQETTLNGLAWWIGRYAARHWRPQVFATLYEGHAWEACLWQGAKAGNPTSQTVGYQHTAIFPESLGLLAPMLPGEAPDVVLGLGDIPVRLMRSGHVPHQTRLVPFGSFRYQPIGATVLPEPTRQLVLVTPEGIPSETRALFQFAYACARALPTYTFVLRSHPQIPMAEALKWAPPGLASQANIVPSDRRGIDEDFARASILLYRGSSSALYALRYGVLPVCLRVEGLPDQDPLYDLPVWRRYCRRAEEFADLANSYERMPAEERNAVWTTALDYVTAYLQPVDTASLQALLGATGLTPELGR